MQHRKDDVSNTTEDTDHQILITLRIWMLIHKVFIHRNVVSFIGIFEMGMEILGFLSVIVDRWISC